MEQFLTYNEIYSLLRNFTRRLKTNGSPTIKWETYYYNEKYKCCTNNISNTVSCLTIRHNNIMYMLEITQHNIIFQIIGKFCILDTYGSLNYSSTTDIGGLFNCSFDTPEHSVMEDLDESTLFQYKLLYEHPEQMLVIKNIISAISTEACFKALRNSYKRV